MTRREKAAKAAELRASGMLHREIAAVFGVSISYACELLNDPTGSRAKARKDRYRGTCKTCGESTTGCNGADSAPDICSDCMAQRLHDERHWTPGRIIEAIQTWHRERGQPPLSTDWQKANRGRRFPSVGKVRHEFGSWRAGIEAAGFQCVEPGRYERTPEVRARLSASLKGRPYSGGRKPRRVDWQTVVSLSASGLSYREIADRVGYNEGHVGRIVRAERGNIRSPLISSNHSLVGI